MTDLLPTALADTILRGLFGEEPAFVVTRLEIDQNTGRLPVALVSTDDYFTEPFWLSATDPAGDATFVPVILEGVVGDSWRDLPLAPSFVCAVPDDGSRFGPVPVDPDEGLWTLYCLYKLPVQTSAHQVVNELDELGRNVNLIIPAPDGVCRLVGGNGHTYNLRTIRKRFQSLCT